MYDFPYEHLKATFAHHCIRITVSHSIIPPSRSFLLSPGPSHPPLLSAPQLGPGSPPHGGFAILIPSTARALETRKLKPIVSSWCNSAPGQGQKHLQGYSITQNPRRRACNGWHHWNVPALGGTEKTQPCGESPAQPASLADPELRTQAVTGNLYHSSTP